MLAQVNPSPSGPRLSHLLTETTGLVLFIPLFIHQVPIERLLYAWY